MTEPTEHRLIGSTRLDMKRQSGWGTVGLYGQGEYLSYVPQVLYNNSDLATGVIWGGISGTRLASSSSTDAFNLTAGIDLSVPLN